MILDYSKIIKKLSKIYMQLIRGYHDYLSNPKYSCYMIANLKYDYLLVPIYFKDCKFFTFITSDIGQF